MREEEDDSFIHGPACVSFRKMSLVQALCTEDDIQSSEPSAKISALPLSPFKSNFQQKHLEKINSSEFSFHSAKGNLGKFV